jgi:DNA-binding NarL/FixJ family response regulator
MIRVAVADDHELVRQGIRALLERSDDIEVVGEAGDGAAAVELTIATDPDVLVMDMTMPVLNGIQAAEELTRRSVRTAVVMLTMHDDAALVRSAVDAGVKAYVLKGSIVDDLMLAIRVAASGGTYLAPNTALAAGDHGAVPPPPGELTERERQVLRLIGDGLTNRAIGSHLGISVKTVERHRVSIMAKLDAHSVVELMRAAFKHGYLTLDD